MTKDNQAAALVTIYLKDGSTETVSAAVNEWIQDWIVRHKRDAEAEAALSIERMSRALEEIDQHVPDQPAAVDIDELLWVRRHVGKLRGIARSALTNTKDADQ